MMDPIMTHKGGELFTREPLPLSDTAVDGNPCVAKICLSLSMLVDVFAELISISSHLECASITRRYHFLRNGLHNLCEGVSRESQD